MKERIKQYMDYKSVSAGDLSNLLEVQRSNISHILNGRNKPGASFIEKLLLTFSDLNARWLMTGEGEMLDGVKEPEKEIIKESPVVGTVNTEQPELALPEKKQPVLDIMAKEVNKSIEKVVVLYSDGTFTDFDRK